jgi:hypothetical protein
MMEPIYHGMSVRQLRALLVDIGDDVILVPNEVKNLLMVKKFSDGFGDIGFIDFAAEHVIYWQPEPPK